MGLAGFLSKEDRKVKAHRSLGSGHRLTPATLRSAPDNRYTAGMQPTYDLPLRTPGDLYEKLQRDAAALDGALTGDAVFNFVVTAWHLAEWIAKGMQSKNPAAFEADVAALKRDTYLQICRDICDASKHFVLTRPPLPKRTVSAATMDFVDRAFYVGSSYVGGEDYVGGKVDTVLTISAGGTTYDFRTIKEEVMQRYAAFFARHGS